MKNKLTNPLSARRVRSTLVGFDGPYSTRSQSRSQSLVSDRRRFLVWSVWLFLTSLLFSLVDTAQLKSNNKTKQFGLEKISEQPTSGSNTPNTNILPHRTIRQPLGQSTSLFLLLLDKDKKLSTISRTSEVAAEIVVDQHEHLNVKRHRFEPIKVLWLSLIIKNTIPSEWSHNARERQWTAQSKCQTDQVCLRPVLKTAIVVLIVHPLCVCVRMEIMSIGGIM